MAPEMKQEGLVKYDNRVDIYALGKLMLKIWFIYVNDFSYNKNLLVDNIDLR